MLEFGLGINLPIHAFTLSGILREALRVRSPLGLSHSLITICYDYIIVITILSSKWMI
ncbi:asl4640 [Nostoc sp. PCC 7120 = FACHB-418]|nr:asl4640 [Nostoc sp. PCC 7120 = FACHB-418]